MENSRTATATRQQSAADALVAKVAQGLTTFRKDVDGTWRVIGPAADLHVGATVTVTKADGSTKKVTVVAVNRTGERNGTAYAIADIRDAVRTASERDAELAAMTSEQYLAEYTTRGRRQAMAAHDAAYAAGRRHGVNGQIWD